MSDLFIDTRDATYIFNQGRCFEQNDRCEDAIPRFREYLRKAGGLSPESRAEGEKHIAECQALLGPKSVPEAGREKASASAAKSNPASSTGIASLPPAVSATTPEPGAVASTSMPAAGSGRGLRMAGLGCGALGVAAVGTGIYFYTQAKYYSDKVTGEAPWNPADVNAGKRAETLQWVFYGAGAAAVITGTALYVAGWHSADGSNSTAGIAPMVGPGLAGISARGAF